MNYAHRGTRRVLETHKNTPISIQTNVHLAISLSPSYMLDILKSYKAARQKTSGTNILAVTRVHSKSKEAAFSFYGPRFWSNLPEDLRCA